MPGIPTIPTDNLYKFMAISGLVIVVVTLILPYTLLWQEYDRSETRMFEISARNEARFIQSAESKAKGGNENQSSEALRLLWEKQLESDLKSVQIWSNARLKFIESAEKRLDRYQWFGLGIGGIGFILWWRRVQRHQDAKLLAEVNLAKQPPK